MLLGLGAVVERVVPVVNAAKSPTRFQMGPAQQLHAFQEMEEQGLELLGIFHSHPLDRGDGVPVLEGPSETDVREAAYPVVHVIWSQGSGGWGAHGFWIEHGTFYEVPLVIGASE